MKNFFKLNDCNVVTNPNTIWKYTPENYLAWCYWEIKTGICINGLWDYGFSTAGGGSPVSLGQYKSEDEAIAEAVLRFHKLFKEGFQGQNMYKEKYFIDAKNSFFQFKNSLLFKSENLNLKAMKSVLDTGSNYHQGSLF